MDVFKFDVINFHLTEKCNYRCTYCFAKFNNENELDFYAWTSAVDVVSEYYKRHKIQNGRINLAGGEPLILKFFDELVSYIHSKDIKVSIITNGSFLTKKRIDNWKGKVDILGVSVDSLNKDTNLLIGRHMDKKVLDIATIIETLKYAQNQGIKIKVNTVISKLNIDEDIIPLYEAIHFDRVKLLQVRIQGNCNETAQKYEISAESFNLYTDKIKRLNPNIIIESESEIESSYIIIDPLGHLISNQNNYHKQVGSIFKEKLEDLIIEAGIQYKLFSKRYTLIDNDNKPMNHNDKTVERFK